MINPLLQILFWLTLVLLVYAQVGYALMMRVAARRAGSSAVSAGGGEQDEWPTVSVIIPAYNEQSVLRAKLENTLELDYPSHLLEILVASDGSSDQTNEIARQFAQQGVRLLEFTRRRGKTAVLNDAAQQATGQVLCLCDTNVMFQPDSLRHLVARLADPQVGAVSGDVRLASEQSNFGQGEDAYYRIERTVQLGESRIGSMMGVDGGMYVLRRELYQRVPDDTIVDDFVIAMRVIRQGKRVVYEPAAVATENATPKARDEFRRRVRLSAGAMQVLKRGDWPPPFARPIEFWQFTSHKLLRWAGPLWLILLFVSSIALVSAGVIYQLALAGQVAFYLLAASAGASLPLRRTRLGGVAFYFVMSHIGMTVGLVKGLFNSQNVAWKRTARGEHEESRGVEESRSGGVEERQTSTSA